MVITHKYFKHYISANIFYFFIFKNTTSLYIFGGKRMHMSEKMRLEMNCENEVKSFQKENKLICP